MKPIRFTERGKPYVSQFNWYLTVRKEMIQTVKEQVKSKCRFVMNRIYKVLLESERKLTYLRYFMTTKEANN